VVAYDEHAPFSAIRDEILGELHPNRRRVLDVRVFRLDAAFNATTSDRLRALATHLDYCTAALDGFVVIDVPTARQICLNVASHELVHGGQLLSPAGADRLVNAWMSAFASDVTFVTGGDVGMLPNIGSGVAPPLTGKDLDAGVVALGKRTAGIFWNSEEA
jgi:hypothetical protein